MFINNKNKILYDTKEFDNHKNIYAVLIDNVKIKANKERVKDYDVLNINILEDIFWMHFPTINISDYKNEFKIVYGHFYNNSDMFLYKNIHSGKIIGHSIKKTYIEKLYFNKNRLIYNKSYNTLVEQLNKLKQKGQEDFNTQQPTLNYQYIYENEEILFDEENSKYLSTQYDNECLILAYTNKTKINL